MRRDCVPITGRREKPTLVTGMTWWFLSYAEHTLLSATWLEVQQVDQGSSRLCAMTLDVKCVTSVSLTLPLKDKFNTFDASECFVLLHQCNTTALWCAGIANKFLSYRTDRQYSHLLRDGMYESRSVSRFHSRRWCHGPCSRSTATSLHINEGRKVQVIIIYQ